MAKCILVEMSGYEKTSTSISSGCHATSRNQKPSARHAASLLTFPIWVRCHCKPREGEEA